MNFRSSCTGRNGGYILSFGKLNETMFRRLIWLLLTVLQLIQSGLALSADNSSSSTGCEHSFQCNDKQCIELDRKCNMIFDCKDFSDEQYCDCSDEEFACISPKKCIFLLWKCDGEADCLDKSDERGCPCASYQFRCVTDGFCIADQLRCDGTINCNDRSDETNCSSCSGDAVMCRDGVCRHECESVVTATCPDDQFLCKGNNTCMNHDQVCDNINFCSDSSSGSSNEFKCGCPADSFTCANGFCIQNDHKCDTVDDCGDNSDEINCSCLQDQIRCDDGRCMDIDSLCGSDCNKDTKTQHCECKPDKEFQCTSSKECIELSAVCDGHHNCEDSSDESEENCVQDCYPNYKCSVGNGCYQELQICDGIPDCNPDAPLNSSDELDCDYTHNCTDGRKLRNYFICDGKEQCEDGSDERDCMFTCNSEQTIISRQVCDGQYDCMDLKDERNCTCPDDLRCPDGLCMSKDIVCDGFLFCKSNFDERNCPCAEFTCTNGLCLNDSSVCDGYNQCGDFSDEISCSCKTDEFKCEGGMCIPSFRRCDGSPQCPDGSDEKNCDCLQNQFTCYDNKTCIKKNWVCDRVKNCPDGSDESECGCANDEFTCDDGSCIDKRYVCNGRVDCHGDSSDELHSNCTCGGGEYRCADGQCIDSRLQCDGAFDCLDSSDEQQCTCSKVAEFDCGAGECIPLSHKCNHRVDCSNKADEADCKCNENEFHCHNERCVADAYICDSFNDCGDWSDETNCKCKAEEFRCSNRFCIARKNSKDCSDEVTVDEGISIIPVDDLKLRIFIPLAASIFFITTLLLLILGKYTPMYKQIRLRLKGKLAVHHPGVEPRRIPYISSPVRDLSYTSHELNRRSLQLGEQIGQGKFGVVHFGTMRLSKNNIIPVAVKSVGLTASQAQKEDFLDEIKLLINIGKHQNIISVIGCCISDEPYLLITELMKYGDLLGFLRTCKKVQRGQFMDDPIYCLKDTDMLNITRQVARGMDYLSRTRYYHGDLAARNILVGEQLTVKVSDFGLADDIYLRGFKRLAPERKRPIAWVSLETIIEGLCTIKSDVWSFGILLYEIVTLGSPPYPDIPLSELVQNLKDGYRMPKPRDCTDEVYEVMMKCWHTFPSRRPTFSELYTTFDLMLQRQSLDDYYVDCTEANIVSDPMIKKRRQSDSTF